MRALILILVAGIAGAAHMAAAQPQQSEDFRISKSVLDAGGGRSLSANFVLTSAFGQPTPIGLASSTDFRLSAGFLSPVFAASPLSPIADLVVQRLDYSGDIRLSWSGVSGASSYVIYRGTSPDFTPSPAHQIGTSTATSFTDINAVALPLGRYYYIVTAVSGSGPVTVTDPGIGAAKSVTQTARPGQ